MTKKETKLSEGFIKETKEMLQSEDPDIQLAALNRLDPEGPNENPNITLIRRVKAQLLDMATDDSERPSIREQSESRANRAALALCRLGDEGLELLITQLRSEDDRVVDGGIASILHVLNASLDIHLPDQLHPESLAAHGAPPPSTLPIRTRPGLNFSRVNLERIKNFLESEIKSGAHDNFDLDEGIANILYLKILKQQEHSN